MHTADLDLKTNYAPIILFVFDRPVHAVAVIRELALNKFADRSDLIIYSDFSTDPSRFQKIQCIRRYLKGVNGFKSVRIIERSENYGLSRSVIEGVTEVLEEYGYAIILEDDLVPSIFFLQYMNEALEKYRDDESVACIHGYVYPTEIEIPKPFFLKGADCWGWATWKRSWKLFNPNGKALLAQLRNERKIKEFNFNNTYPYSTMLLNQSRGKNDSWAIRWYASTFLKNKKTLYPGKSLIKNIGMDSTGINCTSTDIFNVRLSEKSVDLSEISSELSEDAWIFFENFFKKIKLNRMKFKIKYLFSTIDAQNFRSNLKKILPNSILSAIKKITRHGIRVDGPYNTWSEAVQHSVGYDSQIILSKVLSATLRVKQDLVAYERDSVTFNQPLYDWNLINFLLDVKNRCNGKLTVLDFGGSLGSIFFQHKFIFDSLDKFSWNIVEQKHFVETGKKYISKDIKNLYFYESIFECFRNCEPNCLLISSTLQYIPEYKKIMNEIDNSQINFIYIDRTPFVGRLNDLLVVQTVPASIYKASYPMRIFSRNLFDAYMERLWQAKGQGQALDGSFKLQGAEVAYEWRSYVRK